VKTVVTGSSGFVGRHLVRALSERGDSVVAMDVVPTTELDGLAGVHQEKADLRDAPGLRKIVQGADAIFHVASRVQTQEHGSEEVFAINVGGTENLLEACRAEGVRRFVYASSASVVYGGSDIENGDESLPYPAKFHAPYAETKAIAERKVLAAHGRGGILSCSIRPHIIFGPGDTRFLPAILERAEKGKLKAYVGDARKVSDFTYVENLVHGLLLAADAMVEGHAAGGQAYFVTNGEPLAFWEFVGRILDGVGHPRPKVRVPFPIAYGAAAVREGIDRLLDRPSHEASLTRFAIRYLTTHHYFSIEKARRDLGYAPKVSLDRGIAATIAALRS
jgi:sterol-4alpha-carboxylate 3-dehydrogenase (decarboxylating)